MGRVGAGADGDAVGVAAVALLESASLAPRFNFRLVRSNRPGTSDGRLSADDADESPSPSPCSSSSAGMCKLARRVEDEFDEEEEEIDERFVFCSSSSERTAGFSSSSLSFSSSPSSSSDESSFMSRVWPLFPSAINGATAKMRSVS